MSEKTNFNNPAAAERHARTSYEHFKTNVSNKARSEEKLARLNTIFEEHLAADPSKMPLVLTEQMADSQRNITKNELDARLNVAQEKKVVAERLDVYRDLALADAALAGVQIKLQQPEDPGQQIEVHTSEHQ